MQVVLRYGCGLRVYEARAVLTQLGGSGCGGDHSGGDLVSEVLRHVCREQSRNQQKQNGDLFRARETTVGRGRPKLGQWA